MCRRCWASGRSRKCRTQSGRNFIGGRNAPALIDELGETLLAVARRVPAGVVVFVPSFQYEAQLVARWQASGLWRRLHAIKPLFREPRAAADLDALLKEYAAAIQGGGGGVARVAE